MDEINNTVEAAKNTSELANNFYSDIRPIVQPVAKCIGAILDLTSLPVQYMSERARINLKHRLEEYEKKMEGVTEGNRCEVHPEIGVPIMQLLHYTTNDEIADMFTTLLKTASIGDTASNAHPAFVEYIKQMSPDEARIVKYLKNKSSIPHLTIRVYFKEEDKGFITPLENAVSLCDDVAMIYPQNVGVYLSNLLSLGIIEDSGTMHLVDNSLYDKIIEYNHLDEAKKRYEQIPDFNRTEDKKGYYSVTEIGRLFIKACCG